MGGGGWGRASWGGDDLGGGGGFKMSSGRHGVGGVGCTQIAAQISTSIYECFRAQDVMFIKAQFRSTGTR